MDDDRFAEMMRMQARSLEIQSNAIEEQAQHVARQEKKMIGLTFRCFGSKLRTFLVEGVGAGERVLEEESLKLSQAFLAIPDKELRAQAIRTVDSMRWQDRAKAEIATIAMMADALETRPTDVYFLTQDDMRSLHSIRTGAYVRTIVPTLNPELMQGGGAGFQNGFPFRVM